MHKKCLTRAITQYYLASQLKVQPAILIQYTFVKFSKYLLVVNYLSTLCMRAEKKSGGSLMCF